MREEKIENKYSEIFGETGAKERGRGNSGCEHWNRLVFRFVAVIWLVFLLGVVLGASDAAPAERKRLEGTSAGDCAACHVSEQVLPSGHSDTKKMTLQDCTKCHEDGKLRGKLPLFHVHLLNGVVCGGCHGDSKPRKPLKTAQCLACHENAEKIAKKTPKLDPNPHVPPPHADSVDCDLCHHQHAKSENYCAQCHPWDFKVP